MVDFLNKLLRAGEGRLLRRLELVAEETTAWEPTIEQLDDDALRAKTAEFRERLAEGEELDDLLPEAFACVREAARRTLGMRHFDVQLVGGAVLHEGAIAEMKTGEGKTLVATLPLYLNALEGEGAHLVTVNDYLARRDAEWMKPDLRGARHDGRHHRGADGSRRPARAAYACDITYGTNSEFGFDYLRDNLATEHRRDGAAPAHVRDRGRGRLDPRRRGAHAADHRRAAPRSPRTSTTRSRRSSRASRLGDDYEVDEKRKTAAPTESGRGQGREGARHREPLRARLEPDGQPPDPGAARRGAVPQRGRVPRRGRRGQDRRRVHRPHHGGPPLVGGPAPGRRGQGGRQDRGRERHGRDGHDPELLPALREARRHDRHGAHRGQRVPRDLRPRGRADPDQRARHARSTRTT